MCNHICVENTLPKGFNSNSHLIQITISDDKLVNGIDRDPNEGKHEH